MVDTLAVISRFVNRINETLGRALAWLTLAMVITTFSVVLLRYGFDTGWIAMQESVTYLHALVFMGGAAYTLRHDKHVRVDIFYQSRSPRLKAWINLSGTLIFLIPFCLFILWFSWDYVYSSWQLLEGSREAGGLPLVFLLKSCIPLLGVLLLLQAFAILCDSLQTIAQPASEGAA